MVFTLTLETTPSLFNLVFNFAFFPQQCYFLCIWVRCSKQSCNNGSYCKHFSQHCKVALLPEYPITLFPTEISQTRVNQKNGFQFDVFQWALLLVLCLCLKHLKIKAMSQSHSPIQFVLFTFHFDFWVAYNPYPQVQYYGICASLAYKKRVTRTHSQLPCLLEINLHFKIEYFDFFLFAPGIFHSRTSSLSNGTKHQALKMGKNATTLETKFNITRQFSSDTGFQVKANLNMTWCP